MTANKQYISKTTRWKTRLLSVTVTLSEVVLFFQNENTQHFDRRTSVPVPVPVLRNIISYWNVTQTWENESLLRTLNADPVPAGKTKAKIKKILNPSDRDLECGSGFGQGRRGTMLKKFFFFSRDGDAIGGGFVFRNETHSTPFSTRRYRYRYPFYGIKFRIKNLRNAGRINFKLRKDIALWKRIRFRPE
jgi:hypothetical protein